MEHTLFPKDWEDVGSIGGHGRLGGIIVGGFVLAVENCGAGVFETSVVVRIFGAAVAHRRIIELIR